MKVLAIDPGTINCGYAVLEKSKNIHILDAGTLKVSKSLAIQDRLYKIYEALRVKIGEHHIEHIALETPFHGKNLQTFLKLGYVRGGIYILSREHSCTLAEFTPCSIKQAITRWSQAPKDQVARVIYQLFPKLDKNLDDNATDAIAIGLTYLWSSK